MSPMIMMFKKNLLEFMSRDCGSFYEISDDIQSRKYYLLLRVSVLKRWIY